MALLNLGRDILADAVIGGGTYTLFNNANAHIAVGNSSTAYAASQTGLQGASTAVKPMEASYPSRAANVISFRSVFDTASANFTWEEWGLTNALSSGQFLNRKVSNKGTKTSDHSWQFTVDVTIGIGT